MKRVLIIVGLLVAGIGGIVSYIKTGKNKTIEALSIVPTDAIYILQAEDPVNNWNKFSKSNLWSFLKTHPSLEAITEDADYLDKMVAENSFVAKHFGQRHFILSAHMTKKDDYDFLFFIDLQNLSKLKLSRSVLKNMMGKGYKVFEHDYQNRPIFEIYDNKAKDILYLCLIDNQLVCSYTRKLVEKSIDQKKENSLLFTEKFVETNFQTDKDGLFNLFINFQVINDYIGVYSSETKADFLQEEFSFSGLTAQIEDSTLVLNGYTSLPAESKFTRLLLTHGNSDLSFEKVLSKRTAYCQAIGIDNFKAFYSELLMSLEGQSEIDEYNEIKNKVEKVLGLSVEEDLLSWIGKEMVIAQNKSSTIHRMTEDDLLVAIKTTSPEDAAEHLLKIQRQIKKRTPARFKRMEYKNYPIYYLDIKGFFGLFFGKAFDKLTKPYYVHLEDYVIFSNSPKTLVSIIEDYENGNTLENSKSFKAVQEEMPSKSALFTYINGDLSFPVVEKKIKPSERADFNQHKDYFTFFKGIGIHFQASNEGFESKIFANYSQVVDEALSPISTDPEDSQLEDIKPKLDTLTDLELFVVNVVNDGDFIRYYPNSDVARVVAKTRKGKFHGDYKEYYFNGTLKVDGKYRRGKKAGRWKYYSIEGKLEERKWE